MTDPAHSRLQLEAHDKSDWQSFGSTGRTVVLRPDEIAALLVSTDPALQALRARLPELVDVESRDRDIFILARRCQKDGELEFDEAAAIAEGGDNGAYVSGWTWVSFANTPLDKDVTLVRLTLITSDGATGISLYRDDGTETPMTWDAKPDLQTVSAVFEVMRGGVVAVTIPLDGDQWRDLESGGYVVDIVDGFLNGENDAVQHALDELRGVESAPMAPDRET